MKIGAMQHTTLPPDQAERTVVCPSFNRWKGLNGERPGILRNLIHSVSARLSSEGLADSSRIVIGDPTPDVGQGLREFNIAHALADREDPVEHPTDIYVLDEHTQRQVFEEVCKRLRVTSDSQREVMSHLFLRTGYAQNRAKTEWPVAGKVLTLDDDTRVPAYVSVARNEDLPDGFMRTPNSQLLLQDQDVEAMAASMEVRENRIGPIFEPLGRTVAELRADGYGDVRTTRYHKDTMNEALVAARAGRHAQFVVTHDDQSDIDHADNALVVGVTPTKHGIPDYRTTEIAMAAVQKEFPEYEVPVRSVLSGDSVPFAFQRSHTNVDSAALARFLSEGNDEAPWWYLSSEDISNQNPNKTVRMSYRADNELLPHHLEWRSQAIDRPQVYMQGVQTQVTHHRARSGNRPGVEIQAASSLVGNVAATEALRYMHYDGNGHAHMDNVGDKYEVPDEKTGNTFRRLCEMAMVCRRKLDTLSEGSSNERVDRLIGQYKQVYQNLEGMTAGFNYLDFKEAMDTEIRDQLRFFRAVLELFPQVRRVVLDDMVAKGKYPALKYDPANLSTSYGGVDSERKTADTTIEAVL